MTVDVRRAGTRARSRTPYSETAHSFSFGPHYDPDDLGYGLLLASNDEHVGAAGGFPPHAHRELEIVTWVLRGQLRHEDDAGHVTLVSPGMVQVLSAGSGVRHSEVNASATAPLRFVQMWLRPEVGLLPPSYALAEVGVRLARGGLVPVVGGGDAAVRSGQRDAVLWAGRLGPAEQVTLPGAPLVHLYVATGGARLEGAGLLTAGDAVRLTAAGGPRLTADPACEVLVWAFAR